MFYNSIQPMQLLLCSKMALDAFGYWTNRLAFYILPELALFFEIVADVLDVILDVLKLWIACSNSILDILSK